MTTWNGNEKLEGKSLFRQALEMSKEDAKAARIDRDEENAMVDATRLIEDKEREVRDMKLALNDLLDPENLNGSDGKGLLEKVASKKGEIAVAEKRLSILKDTYSDIFEG